MSSMAKKLIKELRESLDGSEELLISNNREEDVEDETTTEDLLHLRAESIDVGPLAAR